MKTILYRDKWSQELLTFSEVKYRLEERFEAEIEIPASDIYEMVRDGIAGINELHDSILDWCNDYAELQEADRYLTQDERDESVKILYENIMAKDEGALQIVKETLDGLEGQEILRRLEILCK